MRTRTAHSYATCSSFRTCGKHELYLICADVQAFIADMKKRNIACGPVHDEGWGLLTEITLPGSGKLGVYQPRHARPSPMPGTRA
jgi:hypothetical protein